MSRPTPSKWSPKDPQDVRDYWVDFTSLLAEGEVVTAATVDVGDLATPDAPYTVLSIVSDDFTDAMVRARFSGGAPGKYGIKYHVVTSTGQEFDLTKVLTIKERTQ